jgi:hypothetical protein
MLGWRTWSQGRTSGQTRILNDFFLEGKKEEAAVAIKQIHLAR